MNVLFVCTENLVRSPLAVSLFQELQGAGGRHVARSAGTASHAPQRLTTRALAWADLVAVMEPGHREVIRARWPRHARKVVVLDVDERLAASPGGLREALEPKLQALLKQCEKAPD